MSMSIHAASPATAPAKSQTPTANPHAGELNPAQQARAADPTAKGAAFGALVSQIARAKHTPAPPLVVTPPPVESPAEPAAEAPPEPPAAPAVEPAPELAAEPAVAPPIDPALALAAELANLTPIDTETQPSLDLLV